MTVFYVLQGTLSKDEWEAAGVYDSTFFVYTAQVTKTRRINNYDKDR